MKLTPKAYGRCCQQMVDAGWEEKDAINACMYAFVEELAGTTPKWLVRQFVNKAGATHTFRHEETPEGAAYWAEKAEVVRWIAYGRKAKWAAKTQKGEISYAQPLFYVKATADELNLVDKGRLRIALQAWDYKDLSDGRSYRRIQEFCVHLSSSKPGEFYVRASSYAGAAAMANWFKDRLPKAFFRNYAAVLKQRKVDHEAQ